MADEKDRFGDKLRDLEKAREDQYFAQQDRKLIERMQARQEAAKEAAQHPGHMRCPKCGQELTEQATEGVLVDKCEACGGIWLDAHELEELLAAEEGWLSRFLGREPSPTISK
jgi:hypothetical protein